MIVCGRSFFENWPPGAFEDGESKYGNGFVQELLEILKKRLSKDAETGGDDVVFDRTPSFCHPGDNKLYFAEN